MDTGSATAPVPGRRLAAEWSFVSDHLPLGATLAWGDDSVPLVSWNVLNSAYLRWIYKDEQGLLGSFITEHDTRDPGHDLTRRDEAVVGVVLDLALGSKEGEPQNRPARAAIALQECSDGVIRQVVATLEASGCDYGVIRDERGELATLYDKRRLRVAATPPEKRYANWDKKAILPVVFEIVGTKKRFVLINTHCPAAAAARIELARTAILLFLEHRAQAAPLVLVGDMNATSQQTAASLDKACVDIGHGTFVQAPGYRTHISASLVFCDYDNMHIAPGDSDAVLACDDPATVLRGLPALVAKLV